MRFWTDLAVVDLLVLCAFLVIARMLAARVPGYRKLALPPAVLAGALALVFGPSGLDAVPLGAHTLEAIVYHGLALVFISMGLQAVGPSGGGLGSRSVAIGIPFLTCGQAVFGLLVVLGWSALIEQLHPGVGLMLPLGFSQGPGQALSMGSAWEEMGMVSGGQIGLTVAALGYLVCIVFGLAMFHLARRFGWADDPDHEPLTPDADADPAPERRTDTGFGLEPLMGQAAIVGTVYLAVFGALVGVSSALADKPQLSAMIWGFHFLFAIIFASLVRGSLRVLKWDGATDDELLARLAGVAVDLTAAAAIAAIQVEQVAEFIGPIVALVVPGALVTLLSCLWLAKRAFPDRPFSHALVMFGTLTGTLPTGMTLLRLEDPDLRGPAARSMIVGVALSIVPAAPLLLKLLPMPVFGWPESFPSAVWTTVGLLLAYMALLAVLWRLLGPLRSVGSPLALWPKQAHPLAKK